MKIPSRLAWLHMAACLHLTTVTCAWAQQIIQWPASSYTFEETAGSAKLPVQRTGPVPDSASVEYFTTELNASNGVHFTPVSGVLRFGPGETNQFISVPVLNNGLVEGTRNFRVTLTNAVNATLGTRTLLLVGVLDNDKGAEFALRTYQVTESAGQVRVGVTRGHDGPGEVRLTCVSTDVSATNGLNYLWETNTITFAPGEYFKLLSVPILNDGARGAPMKTFRLTLTNALDTSLAFRTVADVTILEDDRGVAFEVSMDRVDEGAPALHLNVLRGTDDTNTTVTVDFTTSDLSAHSGEDYVAASGTITFAPGETVKPLAIGIIKDALQESDETFRVVLSNPSATSTGLGPNYGVTVTIGDNDPGFQFRLVPASTCRAFEDTGCATLTVLRGNDMDTRAATVDYRTAAVISGVGAAADQDFVSTNGTLAFAAGEQEKDIRVTIVSDTVSETNEVFSVFLSNPTGGTVLGRETNATVQILDCRVTSSHKIDSIAPGPNAAVQMQFSGGTDDHFQNFFDIFPLDVSSDLVTWQRLTNLVRTNWEPAALQFTDMPGPEVNRRFYRTLAGPMVSAWPKPTGPFPVGIVHRQVSDPARLNRYGIPTNSSFMVSVLYPAVAGGVPARHFDPLIANDPTWAAAYGYGDFASHSARLMLHAVTDAPAQTNSAPFPVLVISPGLTGMRIVFTYLGSFFASHGYIVAIVDHEDAMRTVFPDGRYIKGSPVNFEGRVTDLEVVMRELKRWNSSDPVLAGKLNPENVAGLGTSYGVGTVVHYYVHNSSFKALIGYDGGDGFTGPQIQVPSLSIRAGGVAEKSVYDLTARDAVWFQVVGANHMIVACPDGYYAWLPTSIPRAREMVESICDYTLWFLNRHLKGATDPIPDPQDYPLISNFKHK